MKQPLKVLSTSLGVLLVSHMLVSPAGSAASAEAAPVLAEWSSEQVKAYFDPAADWSLPLAGQQPEASPTPAPSAGGAGSGSTVIYDNGFGWDDLLLYHMILNAGSPYSSSRWTSAHPSYHYKTNQPYVAKSYSSQAFSNRSATKAPTTSSGSGSFTKNSSSTAKSGSKTTSASSRSIGGKSSGFSSSGGSGGSFGS